MSLCLSLPGSTSPPHYRLSVPASLAQPDSWLTLTPTRHLPEVFHGAREPSDAAWSPVPTFSALSLGPGALGASCWALLPDPMPNARFWSLYGKPDGPGDHHDNSRFSRQVTKPLPNPPNSDMTHSLLRGADPREVQSSSVLDWFLLHLSLFIHLYHRHSVPEKPLVLLLLSLKNIFVITNTNIHLSYVALHLEELASTFATPNLTVAFKRPKILK